jgi:hypothetical protein
MPTTDSIPRLLDLLEQSKTRYGPGEASRVAKFLRRLAKRRITGAEDLIRFHETLLFLRAFPQGPQVVAATERLLSDFHRRIEAFHAAGGEMDSFDSFEVSGMAGTSMQDTLSFDVMRWLVRRIPRNLSMVWDDYEEERAMAATWPRFLPLLEEDGDVEANIPWSRWLRAARGRAPELEWWIRRFEALPISDREKGELYGSLRLPVRWDLGNLPLSRTRNRWPTGALYYHREPLISRSQVSLERELSRPAPVLKKLSRSRGEAVMEKIREVMLVRYRELYGTTVGDPRSVVEARLGRGVVLYLWGLSAERRLPLRAYVAGFTIKNGVPINYVEAIGLCEWLEVGFNTFYTFRNGETAWIYAQLLRCITAYTAAKCISVYPYQIGDHNEEAIESGAFWFYRKLGFHSGSADLRDLTEREEGKIAGNPKYRTPPRALRKLAGAHLFYELPGADPGAWHRFSARNLGLAVNQRMAREYAGDSGRIREASEKAVERALGISTRRWSDAEGKAFRDWALVLAGIPDLAQWSSQDKAGVAEIVRAKAGRDEMRFLRLTGKHAGLRRELLRLGSKG